MALNKLEPTQQSENNSQLYITSNSIFCRGSWTVSNLKSILANIESLTLPKTNKVIVDGKSVKAMDSSGAWAITQIINRLKKKSKVDVVGFIGSRLKLIKLMQDNNFDLTMPAHPKSLNLLAEIGVEFKNKFNVILSFLHFIGEVASSFLEMIRLPKRFSILHLLTIIYETGVLAMPIVGLLSFLIGIVLA